MPRFKRKLEKAATEPKKEKKKHEHPCMKYQDLITSKTKYRPDWPDKIIDMMAEGKSLTQVARELGVTRMTLHNLKKRIPELESAIKIGTDWSLAYWESIGVSNMENRHFSVPLYNMYMRNRFNWTTHDPAVKVKNTATSESKVLTPNFHPLAKDL